MSHIVDTIYYQLGGNKFRAMTGTHSFRAEGNYTLHMTLLKNKSGANHLKIFLNSLDLYDMTFSYISSKGIFVKSVHNNIYNDMLAATFTEVTGLNTSL